MQILGKVILALPSSIVDSWMKENPYFMSHIHFITLTLSFSPNIYTYNYTNYGKKKKQ